MPERVGIRYCGGCNPRYDRVSAVNRLKKLLPETAFVNAVPGERYDAVIVVSGCSTMCAKTEDLSVSPGRLFRLNGFGDVIPLRDSLQKLEEQTESKGLSHEQVLELLPHRFPMLWVDEAEMLIPGEQIRVRLAIPADHPVFQGHFPGSPVFPGVLALEAIAQASDLLLLSSERYRGMLPLFMGADRVSFRRPLFPGDRVEIHSTVLEERPELSVCTLRGQILKEGAVAVTADVTLAMRPAADASAGGAKQSG